MPELTKERFEELKEAVERTKRKADEARGELNVLMRRLKEEFGCSTIKEAKKKLEELEKKTETAQENFNRLLKEYEKKWHEARE